jgi:hypothetical protein
MAGIFEESDVEILLFILLGLLVCGLVLNVLTRYDNIIPYAVAVFAIGLGLSGVLSVPPESTSALGGSLRRWSSIDGELLLFLFAPIIIFGEAMNLNKHHVYRKYSAQLP